MNTQLESKTQNNLCGICASLRLVLVLRRTRQQRQEINGREEVTASLPHTATLTYTFQHIPNLQIVYRNNYQSPLV